MREVKHLTRAELDAGLDVIRQSPRDMGTLEMIVCRPAVGARHLLESGELDLVVGLVGDNWKAREEATPNRSPNLATQLTLMNARAIALLAQDRSRWALAGDQLFVDFDLSEANVPAGTRLLIGEALVEVTAEPHNGCRQFVERYGRDAQIWVNSPVGKELHLRGVNARVIQPGTIRTGQAIRKFTPPSV